jgi:hypothetical protein
MKHNNRSDLNIGTGLNNCRVCGIRYAIGMPMSKQANVCTFYELTAMTLTTTIIVPKMISLETLGTIS